MAKTHFCFDGKISDQVNGVAIGSLLRPAMTNLCPNEQI